jgi:N-ethylmaleimide reductase
MTITAFPHLFSHLKLGAFDLSHRIFLSCRSELLAVGLREYCAARITEGGLAICTVTPADVDTPANPSSPGLQAAAEVNDWRKVTSAIHERGGVAVARIGDVPWQGASWPNADEVDEALDAYRRAAENAGDAGFDGVELVATKGSFPERLLSAPDVLSSALQTLLVVWPRSRVGLGMSLPETGDDLDAAGDAIRALGNVGLAYTHLARSDLCKAIDADRITMELKACFPGGILVSGNWTLPVANSAVRDGMLDAVGPLPAVDRDSELPESWRTALARP